MASIDVVVDASGRVVEIPLGQVGGDVAGVTDIVRRSGLDVQLVADQTPRSKDGPYVPAVVKSEFIRQYERDVGGALYGPGYLTVVGSPFQTVKGSPGYSLPTESGRAVISPELLIESRLGVPTSVPMAGGIPTPVAPVSAGKPQASVLPAFVDGELVPVQFAQDNADGALGRIRVAPSANELVPIIMNGEGIGGEWE